MKITLSEWAARNFSPAPHRNTLTKWLGEGRIYPLPVFIGRAYYVDENARYVGNEHRAPARPDLTKKPEKQRLTDRINGLSPTTA